MICAEMFKELPSKHEILKTPKKKMNSVRDGKSPEHRERKTSVANKSFLVFSSLSDFWVQ